LLVVARLEDCKALLQGRCHAVVVALGGGWVYGWAWLDPAMGVVGAVLDGLLPEEDAGRLSASQAARSCP